METENLKLTVIGAGNMGGAVVRGLAKGNLIKNENIAVCDKQEALLVQLKSEYPGINTSSSNLDFLKEADVIILAVKPYLIEVIADEIKHALDLDRQIIVSIAAGINFGDLARFFSASEKCFFRVIPNTAIELAEGVSTIASINASKEQELLITSLFKELGKCFFVPESQFDAMMALSSCGIAYAFRYVYAAVLGGIEMGIQPLIAKEVVLQTLRGAIEVLEERGTHPAVEIERVTTPGGFTIKGLNEMEAQGFTNAVIKGLKASSSNK